MKFLAIIAGIMALWGAVSSIVCGFMSKKIKDMTEENFSLKNENKILKERIEAAGKTNQELADIKKEASDAKKKPVSTADLNDI